MKILTLGLNLTAKNIEMSKDSFWFVLIPFIKLHVQCLLSFSSFSIAFFFFLYRFQDSHEIKPQHEQFVKGIKCGFAFVHSSQHFHFLDVD